MAEALDRLMADVLSEEESVCLSMSAVAGLSFADIARAHGFRLSSGEPDKKKAYRRVASATRKLRRRMTEQADQLVEEVADPRLTRRLALAGASGPRSTT